MRRVPEPVADLIDEIFGERGRQWLADLPRLIDDRCTAWELEITAEAFSGGTHSYVAPVQRGDGTPAVLKLPVVDEENIAEATALMLYDGDGAIELYDFDAESGALLLEYAQPGDPLVYQLDDGPALEGKPENAWCLDIAYALYRRLWRPVPETPGFPPFPRVTDLVAAWQDKFSAVPGGALPSHLVARALDLCRELTEPDGELGLVNRDTHLGNIVSAQREPWLLIDPKPLYGERAFDAGFLINKQIQHRPDPGFAGEAVARTAEGLGVTPARARAWAFLRAMENASAMIDEYQSDDFQRQMAIATALS